MAKKTTEAAESKDLAQKSGAALAVAHDYGAMSGRGFENQTNADISIPFLGVLQPMSPEVERGNAAKIDGAEAGMLFNNVTNELYPDGVYFQPVDTDHCFVEWRPRNQGGGFVAKHAIDSELVKKVRSTSAEFNKLKTPAGNDLIETFYVLGYILRDGMSQTTMGEPVMIAFTSTKIKVYKSMNTRVRTIAGRPPLFANRLKITTVSEKNNKGTFFNFKIDAADGDLVKSLIPPTLDGKPHPLLVAGEELLKASRSGMTKVNYDSQGGDGGGDEAAGGGGDVPF